MAGNKLAANAQAGATAHEQRLFAVLTSAEQAALQRILLKFRKSAAQF
jgi:DNA-binding MarR family transcriptional regulator